MILYPGKKELVFRIKKTYLKPVFYTGFKPDEIIYLIDSR